MSWSQLDPKTKRRIEKRLTKRQLDVLILTLAGCSQRRIATMLTLHRSTVQDHLRIAHTVHQEELHR